MKNLETDTPYKARQILENRGRVIGVAMEDSTPIGGGYHRASVMLTGTIASIEINHPLYLSSKPLPWYARLWQRIRGRKS